MRPFTLLSLLLWLPTTLAFAQDQVLKGRGPFTQQDSLKGQYDAIRAASDVKQYRLEVAVDPSTQRIAGEATLTFTVVDPSVKAFRFELDTRMAVTAVFFDSGTDTPVRAAYQQNGPFYTLAFDNQTVAADPETGAYRLRIAFEGAPPVAKQAPWDGGFVWAKDPAGKPWVSVACEGEGASLWWPCKDHPQDEPEQGVELHLTAPKGLVAVGNGRLLGVTEVENGTRYSWDVRSPINLYNVNLAIGDYAHLQDHYVSKTTGDTLTLDYYVLKANAERARAHFGKETAPMLAAFEHHFGPYPWYADGYKLVETPFWGMEHQSSIAYGNNYKGLPVWLPFNETNLFDFILVHESGHEWFGNSISTADKADLWIHEAFTTYAEAVYVEYHHGYEKAQRYLNAQRRLIENQQAIVGPAGVAFDGYPDADMYFKGAWLLHTLRHAYTAQLLADQAVASEAEATERWWDVLRTFYKKHARQVIRYRDVQAFFEAELGPWAGTVLAQYLLYTDIPTLELHTYPTPDGKLMLDYRLVAPYPALELPLVFDRGVALQPVVATVYWQSLVLGPIEAPGGPVTVSPNRFLLLVKHVTDTNE